jgi:uncharacterized membrane protein YozB (DUF420 family)
MVSVESPQRQVWSLLVAAGLPLLLVQTTLMATGRRSQHMSLGILAASLLPFLALAMIGTVQSTWSWIASIPAVAMPAEALSGIKFLVSNILREQIRIFFLFVGLVTWAVLLRRTNPEWHKRLMIFAPVLALPAATARMMWVPTTLPESPLSIHLVSLLLLLPLLVYDIARRGRIGGPDASRQPGSDQ